MTEHIKIYGVKPRIQYVADGSLRAYSFSFAIFKASDIDVYLDDIKQQSSAYSVTTTAGISGGTVTLNTAPTAGTIITIVRNLSIERTTDFQEGGALRANTLNDELDYQIACQQQIAENLNRSMVLPPYAMATNVDLTLPTPSSGKAIIWNAAGTNLENSTVEINALESTLNGYKTAAEGAASTATTKAGIASDKADIATTQAQTATTQAGIATQKAQEAATILSDKANKSLDNLSATGKSTATQLALPGGQFIQNIFTTIGTTAQTYTVPANGYIGIYALALSNSIHIKKNNVEIVIAGSSATNWSGCYFGVLKDDVITVTHESQPSEILTFFEYAKGEIA